MGINYIRKASKRTFPITETVHDFSLAKVCTLEKKTPILITEAVYTGKLIPCLHCNYILLFMRRESVTVHNSVTERVH